MTQADNADSVNLALNHAMLCIQTLDPDAHLDFSHFTGKWYLSSRIEISDGAILSSITEHEDTPEAAVFAYFDKLKWISLDEVIVAKPTGQRRHYRWNGAAFAEQYDHRLKELEEHGRR